MTPHGVADPTQFVQSHHSAPGAGYLWRLDLPYPEWDAPFEEWEQTTTLKDRTGVSFEMQELFNSRLTAIPLYYPDKNWTFRPDAYTDWEESSGFGIVHKWSFLPEEVRNEANVVAREIE